MTMLDDRARLAVDAIESSVADQASAAGFAGFAVAQRRQRVTYDSSRGERRGSPSSCS